MKTTHWFVAFFTLLLIPVIVSMTPVVTTIPALHYLVRAPKVKTANPPLLVLLHGVGSNEQHMFSMASITSFLYA